MPNRTRSQSPSWTHYVNSAFLIGVIAAVAACESCSNREAVAPHKTGKEDVVNGTPVIVDDEFDFTNDDIVDWDGNFFGLHATPSSDLHAALHDSSKVENLLEWSRRNLDDPDRFFVCHYILTSETGHFPPDNVTDDILTYAGARVDFGESGDPVYSEEDIPWLIKWWKEHPDNEPSMSTERKGIDESTQGKSQN